MSQSSVSAVWISDYSANISALSLDLDRYAFSHRRVNETVGSISPRPAAFLRPYLRQRLGRMISAVNFAQVRDYPT